MVCPASCCYQFGGEKYNMVKVLEEKDGTLSIQTDDGKVILVSVNDFSRLKFKEFAGKAVNYKFDSESSVHENKNGSLTCILQGEETTIEKGWPTKSAIARAIYEHKEKGQAGLESYQTLWAYSFLREWLGLTIRVQPYQSGRRGPGLDILNRDKSFVVPYVTSESKSGRKTWEFPVMWIKEHRANKDKSKVAMLVMSSKTPFWEDRQGKGYTRVVALCGVDEAKNAWLHYVDPSSDRLHIDDLERLLVKADPKDEIEASWNRE